MIAPADPNGNRAADKQVIFSLQVLRGVAAALVLLRHTAKFAMDTQSKDAFGIGQAGVDVFFVVSGIVIYLTGRNLSWDGFLRRRLARVAPLYWLVIAIALVAAAVGAGPWPPLSNLLASLTFVPALDQNGDIYPVVAVGWTLNFEMYFYAICTLALLLAPRRLFIHIVSMVVIAGIVIGGPLFWVAGPQPAPAPLILLLPISIEFVAGMWLAKLWTSGFRTPLWGNALLLAAATAWWVLAPVAQPYSLWRPLAWGVPAAMLVWAMIASEEKITFARWRGPLLLGDSSYALYLFHPIVLAGLELVLRKLHIHPFMPLKLAAGVGLSVTAAIVVHLLIERRLVRVATRVLGLHGRVASAALGSADAPAATR